jgi:predicted hotdog family 3-hydroxylacyl-ACP dehydratase
MLLDKAHIQTLIPHAGAMCLLEEVAAWDEDGIVCLTRTHRDPANPLRQQGRLAMVHACEYGAQAAAIHGGLRAQAAGQSVLAGYLAALRDVRWFAADLAAVDGPLEVAARLVLGDTDHGIYAIRISAAGQMLAEARITIAPQPKNGDSGS